MKELKPCPFCGGPAAITRQKYVSPSVIDDTILEYYKYRPVCLRCFVQIPDYRYKTAEDAINAWNSRA